MKMERCVTSSSAACVGGCGAVMADLGRRERGEMLIPVDSTTIESLSCDHTVAP